MNKQLNLMRAEVVFWRETISQATATASAEELERMHQALILAQNKLLATEITRPSITTDCGISVAYH